MDFILVSVGKQESGCRKVLPVPAKGLFVKKMKGPFAYILDGVTITVSLAITRAKTVFLEGKLLERAQL